MANAFLPVSNDPNFVGSTSVIWHDVGQRLSLSKLWQFQEEFYAQQGITAWDSVPLFITSNPMLASLYADLIIAYVLDNLANFNPKEPIYITELATGSGRFAYFLLIALTRKWAYLPQLKPLKWVLILTDFAESNVLAWHTNPKFKPYIDQGTVDFAVFRPNCDKKMHLVASKTTLDANRLKNPWVVFCNYFFDSIPHDLFKLNDVNELMEVQVSLYGETATPKSLSDIKIHLKPVPCPADYYDNPIINELLADYAHELKPLSEIIIPISAFDCIDNLRELSNNNLMLISGDKGTLASQ